LPKTIIHIGYPKTATTWFIKQFYPKVKNASVIYYDDISFDMTEGQAYFNIKPDKLNTAKELQIIMTHIFSGLVNGSWENGKYRFFFVEHLKKMFPDATIVLFIRNQFDLITSLYSSYLKRGCTFKIDKLFTEDLMAKGNTVHYEFLDYLNLICLYQENFGKDRVRVYVYEDLLKDNTVFLKNYISHFGLDIDINNIVFTKSNEKLRSGLASFVRHTNMLISRGPQPKKNIMNLPWIYSLINKQIDQLNKYAIWGRKINNESIMGEKLVSDIQEYYKVSNKKLMDDFGLGSIQEYGYPL
jgi:hypothetical protein